jgi:hypothetical protein
VVEVHPAAAEILTPQTKLSGGLGHRSACEKRRITRTIVMLEGKKVAAAATLWEECLKDLAK